MQNKNLRALVAILLCIGVLCSCSQSMPTVDETVIVAADETDNSQSGLVFLPLQEEPDGIAGLNPTSDLLMEQLEAASQQRAALIVEETEEAPAAAAAPATAAFNQTSAGDYSALARQWRRTVNDDIRGWIRVPGTNINYAVCYHPDVDYYTHRGYYKESSYMGVIWTNGNTKFGTSSQISNNTVLYGHNWTNVSANPRIASPNDQMFAQLTGYHHLSVAQANPYIYYSTEDANMTFKIFACFYTELGFNYISTSGGQNIIDEAIRRSRHKFDVDVNSSDKILTLSTCTRAYGQTSNQRFVVMARLLRPGETVSPYSITSRPNHKQPSVW